MDPRLVAQLSDANLPTTIHLGEIPALPAGMDAAAYRIVQEALTNVIKHAGGAEARVEVGRLTESRPWH